MKHFFLSLILSLMTFSAFAQLNNEYRIDFIELNDEESVIHYSETINKVTRNKEFTDNDGFATLYLLTRSDLHPELANQLKEKPRLRYLARTSFERMIKEYTKLENELRSQGYDKEEVGVLISEARKFMIEMEPDWNDLSKEDFNDIRNLTAKLSKIHEYEQGREGIKMLNDIIQFDDFNKSISRPQVVFDSNLFIEIQTNKDPTDKTSKVKGSQQ